MGETPVQNNKHGGSDEPLVTIGMPLYNGEKYLERAIDSLLAQTHTNFELIFSDDASADRTGEICRKYVEKDKRISYYRNDANIGMVENFRKTADMARGKYFVWAAQDDFWEADFIRELVNELESHPEAGLAMSAFTRYKEHEDSVETIRFELNAETNPNNMNYLNMTTAFIIPSEISKVPYHIFLYGLYRTGFLQKALETPIPDVPAHDRLLMCHIGLSTKVRYVDKFLFRKTIHKDPLAVRYAGKNEVWTDLHNKDRFGYTKTWLAIEPYLWASKIIPELRKHLIRIISNLFQRTNWMLLYRSHVQAEKQKNGESPVDALREEMRVIEQLQKEGLLLEAHMFVSDIAVNYPDVPDILFILAQVKFQIEYSANGKALNSKKILSDIIKQCPGHANALKLLGFIKMKSGDNNEAIELLERARAEAPDDKEIDGLLQQARQSK